MPRPFTLLAAVLACAGLAAMYWPREQPAQATGAQGRGGATEVVVSVAERRTFTDRIEALANALANEAVVITADTDGRVEQIHFEEGQQVAAGALLVTLDSDKERAQLNAARVNLDTQRTQYRRLLDLVKRNSAAQTDLDTQTNLVKQAEADLEVAQANLADRRILAPFAGKLGIRRLSRGALVNRDTEIVTLDDLAVMKLAFSVPERYFGHVRDGLVVEVQSAAYPGLSMQGRVTTVGSRVDPVTRTFEVRARLPNPDGRLRPGMLMTVALLLPERESVAVAEESLVALEQRQFVFRVDAEDKAQRVAVTLGARRPGLAEVLAGIEAGDRVIVEGTTRVRAGGEVKVIETRALADVPAAQSAGRPVLGG